MFDDPLLQGVLGNAVWAGVVRVLLWPAAWLVRRLKRTSAYKPVVLCLRHRLNAREKYYEAAFASGGNVLIVSIMSQHTLSEIEQYLELAKTKNTTLRVLTWDHQLPPSVVDAFQRHLGEHKAEPNRSQVQVQQAARGWSNYATRYGNLIVREYNSTPTMQAVVVSQQWALIEVLPYQTVPNDRPALLLTRHRDPEAFQLFSDRLERLWNDAHQALSAA